ncbi:MAG: ATP synthase F0 subunit B [Candidatus Yonathbacteria bacterium RIFCSPLOWO2_01_FULL_43_27]|uniref:ATP synthase subunit b n=2 Tax=Parcubacteria group TaxID=1794811 RepID=A0A1G2SE42_9BACT|nr:MAG: ATP synthase subunit b [Candidatus Azambacteria bacterium GW2011_GWA1_44_9]OHA78875.1 MAG: ATP synthase F0 subunit B [Candidatus Yonathbacteria bacterium RIFCSPHIGHO2_01_FULL_44_19]OHA82952.1 MAG: ATP synthase F0 subunit B [Candidatus Yonathbacteria bacterium RIFCSPLOWO2_01_FULL_43_27]
MEQIISVFGIDWKLILIQAVNFGLLLFVLHRFLYKPILAVVDARREKIERSIKNALRAEEDLGKAEAERIHILHEARLKGDELIEGAKKSALGEEHVIIKDAHRRAEYLLRDAERRIEREREEMVEKTERDVARMAVLAAEKILRTS